MKAVILAGGYGTRLKPYTQIIPKPLLPVGDRAVLEIQIEHFRKFGIEEILLATYHKSDYLEQYLGDGSRYGIKLTVSKEKFPLGTCGPLSLLKNQLVEPFIVINGDILTTMDFAKFSQFSLKNSAALTVASKKISTPFSFGELKFDGDTVTGINEKPLIEHHVVTGIYFMQPSVFRFIPSNVYFGMDDLMKNMLASRARIARFEMEEYWLDIGRAEDYKKAQNLYGDTCQDFSPAEIS